MKIYPKLIALFLVVFGSGVIFGQMASYPNHNDLLIKHKDGWPECAIPDNILVNRLDEGIQIDFIKEELFEGYYFEVEFVGINDDVTYFSSSITTQRFSVPYTSMNDRIDCKVKIRRVCLGNNMLKFYSGWWENVAESECTAGSISGGGTMCPGIAPQAIISTQPGAGGTGIYLWKEKAGGCTSSSAWVNAAGTNNQETYTPPVLSSTKSYKRVYSCGETNCVTYSVSANNLSAGSISGAQTVCNNVLPSELLNVTPPTGGSAAVQTDVDYIWQSSPWAGTGYQDISGSNKLNYAPGITTSNTYFRRKAMLGSCVDVYTNSVLITVNTAPQLSIVKTPSDSVCGGSTVNLTANGGYNYLWNTGASGYNINVAPQHTMSYTVTATNYSGSCSSTSTVTVHTKSCLVSRQVVANFNACNNNEINITGFFEVSNALTGEMVIIQEQVSGLADTVTLQAGVNTYNYQILNIPYSSATSALLFTSPTVYISPNLGQINLTYNQQGNAPPVIEGDFEICQGESTELSINTSGYEAYFSWNTGNTSQSITVFPTTTTTYMVTITYTGGCVYVISKTILVNTPIGVSISGPINFTQGQTITLSSSYAGTGNLWNTGENTQNIQVIPSPPSSIYSVTISDQNGCTSSAQHVVNLTNCIFELDSIDISISPCDNNLGTYNLSGSFFVLSPMPVSGSQVNIEDLPSNISSPVVTFNNNNYYTFSIDSLPADGLEHHVEFTTTCGTVYLSSSYIAPPACTSQPCSVYDISFDPLVCNNNSYNLSGVFLVNNASNGQNFYIYLKENGSIIDSTIVIYPNTYFQFLNLSTSGSYGEVMILSASGCDYSKGYQVPVNCVNECGITLTPGECDQVNGTYTLKCFFKIGQPVPGTIVPFNHSSGSFGHITLTEEPTYVFEIPNLPATGQAEWLTINSSICSNPIGEYVAPQNCQPVVCKITKMEAAPTICDSNTYSISGKISFYGQEIEPGEVIQILDASGLSTSITLSNDIQYSFSISNIPADGREHIVSVLNSGPCGGFETSYMAPASCSGLPEYECGTEYVLPNVANTSPLSSLYPGNLIYAAGLAIEVTTASGSNGSFSGEGLLAHPFKGLPLKVSFTGIQLNTDKQLVSGQIEGVRATYATNFNVPAGTINFGGEICIEESQSNGEDEDGFDENTGLNDRGFGRDSLYYPDSTKYDPFGFDYEGLYRDGTRFDDFGCDVDGYDADGNPCVRDSALMVLRDSLSEIINTEFIDAQIDILMNKLTDSLQNFNCDSLRNLLNGNISTLGYTLEDEVFIKGKDNIYFNEGLNKHFAEEPQQLLNQSNRNQASISLENSHVGLYKCDLFKEKYTTILSQVNTTDRQALLTHIKDHISKLSKGQIETLKQENNFHKWILDLIANFILNGNIGLGEIKSFNRKYELKQPMNSAFYSLASDSNVFYSKKSTEEEESWLFNQGFRNINGKSRGFFLNEVYNQSLITSAPPEEYQLLPIPLFKDTANATYKIFLDNIKILPSGAKLDAYFYMKDPNSNQEFVMEAENINWGAGGVIGDVNLKLLSTVEIRLTNSAMLILNPAVGPNGGSFVTWDCNGFKGMQIDASIELCPNLVVPLDPVSLAPLADTARYKFDFILYVKSWNDIYFELNGNQAKPFAIKGIEDYKWTISKVAVDFSDSKSPTGINMFPEYTSPFYNSGSFDENWKGLYIGQVSVTMSNSFGNGGQPITAGGQNIVIDDKGVSGKVFASPIVSLENGDLGGWPFSLDTLSIIAHNNSLIGGGIAGQIQVPIFKKPMRYKAQMSANRGIEFVIRPSATEEIDMLLAEAEIYNTSSVKVTITNGDVLAKATINGKVKVGSLGGSTVSINIPDIELTNLIVSNKAPYFKIDGCNIVGSAGASLMGFELAVDKIKPYNPDAGRTAVSFDAAIILPIDMSASGGLDIIGKLEYDNMNRQRWVYERTKLNSFGINSKFPGGHVTGYFQSFDQSNGAGNFGKGFQGMVSLQLNSIGKFDAMGLFGKTTHNNETFKYFFIDASAELTTGIPIGPIEINGFVGGVSYRMNTQHNSVFGSGSNPKTLPAIGQSFSGIQYTPDFTKGLGLRAGGKFRFAKSESAFNGLLAFDFLFNSSQYGGGLAKMGLTGIGQLMSKDEVNGSTTQEKGKKPEGVSSPLSLHLRIEYDNNNGVLKGDLETYLTLGVFRGAGDKDKMVDAELYVDSKKWWFYFGTPSQRCGIKANLGVIEANMLSYLDIGSIVPNMPALPSNVRSIADKIHQNQTFRSNGAGFVMGASFDVKASLNVGIASGWVSAGLGYDVMLRDFGNATCSGSSSTLGINGWYATGQMWAYLEGSLSVLSVNVLSAGLAAVLQAQLPNPTFAQATVGVKVKTIFGSFHKNMKVKFGDPCTIIEDGETSPLGMKVISDINPGSGATRLTTDAEHEISFNLPINSNIELSPDVYKAKIEEIKVKSLKTGKIYAVEGSFNEELTSISYKPSNVYDGKDSIQLMIKVGVWKNGANPIFEMDSTTFTTLDGYSYIPAANVEASYPISGMNNYYIQENNTYRGFVKLKSGMPHLFYNIPEGMTQKVRLTNHTGSFYDFEYTYDPIESTLYFPLDPDYLTPNTNYKIELIRESVSKGNGTQKVDQGISIGDQLNSVSLGNISGGNNPLAGGDEILNTNQDVVLFSIYFRTSIYPTFASKILAGVKNKGIELNEGLDVIEAKNLIEFNLLTVPGDYLNTMVDKIYKIYPIINVYEYANNVERDCEISLKDENYMETLVSSLDLNPSTFSYINANSIKSAPTYKSGLIKSGLVNVLKDAKETAMKQIDACNESMIIRNSQNVIIKVPIATTYGLGVDELRNLNILPLPAEGLQYVFTYTIPGLGTTSTIKRSF